MSDETRTISINPMVALQETALKAMHDEQFYQNRVRELGQKVFELSATVDAQLAEIERLQAEAAIIAAPTKKDAK